MAVRRGRARVITSRTFTLIITIRVTLSTLLGLEKLLLFLLFFILYFLANLFELSDSCLTKTLGYISVKGVAALVAPPLGHDVEKAAEHRSMVSPVLVFIVLGTDS